MKTGEQFRRAHIGRHVEDSEELWADDTRAADDRAILLKVRDMVKAVVDEAKFKFNLEKMKGLTEIKMKGHPEKAVEVLAQKAGLSETEGSALLRTLVEGGDLSAWGMLNAVTSQAHEAKSYDRAVEIEAAGGMLLDLPAGDWKQVMEAK
jgi:S-adenosylhomocysteine hydrolase